MQNQTIILFIPIALAGCQIENKISNLNLPEGIGECDFDVPPLDSEDIKPIAMCQSNRRQIAPLRESADLFGDESYDPNGYDIIDYQWTLVEQPDGSGVSFSDRSANSYGFTPDLAGDYVFQLVVANDRCVLSDPCEVSLSAVPNEDLWIELSWEHPGDDMDLHLIENNAAYDSEGDCYFGNCVSDSGRALDWGQPGILDDNPKLDLDDIDGTGPENINISVPAEGVYTVMIHDYPGSEFYGANTASLRIHLAGEIAFEDTVTIEGEDSRTPVAVINWPAMSVDSLLD